MPRAYCGGRFMLHFLEFMVTKMIPRMALKVDFTREDDTLVTGAVLP
jgi:hypothetical protein